MKTAELTGAALDWAVAKCEGETVKWEGKGTHAFLTTHEIRVLADWDTAQEYTPSTDWAQGGPIIEREGLSLTQFSDYPQWTAKHPYSICYDGPTPLVAAMRCYVASKLGAEIDIPEELI